MKKRLLLLVAGAAVPLLGMEPTQANKQQKKTWSKNTTEFLSYYTHCALKQSDYEKALEELAKLGFAFNLHDQHRKTTIEEILFDVMLTECAGVLKAGQDLRPIIEQCVAAGKDWAIKRKIIGLQDSCYGYEKNEAELRDFIEQNLAAGKDWAIQKKIAGLQHSWYGYEKNEEAARDLIDQHAAVGNDYAIQMKIMGQGYGSYGYEKNEEAARDLIDRQAVAGNHWAINNKIGGLLWGDYGYERNEAAAREFIDQQAALGSECAIRAKIQINSELPKKLLPILQPLAEKVYAMPRGLITLLEIEKRTKFEKK